MPVFSLSDVLENIKHEHHVAQQQLFDLVVLRGGRQVSSSFIDKQSYKPYFLRRRTFTSIVIWVLLYRGKTVTSYSTVAAGNVSLIEASSSRCGRLSFFQLFFPRVCSLRRVCACGAVVICHTLIKGIQEKSRFHCGRHGALPPTHSNTHTYRDYNNGTCGAHMSRSRWNRAYTHTHTQNKQ